MTALYVDTDPFACAWTENLIAAGHVAPGEVWNRDVWDIVPAELERFTQVHLFAGIAVWSYALRCAGWPDDRPVWTASCPCQPFSSAGARKGTADERHAWPAVLHLIEARRPVALLGEQVSSTDGLEWFSVVQSDLDGAGFTVGGMDTCAAGVGAPHRRQRLYFVADSEGDGRRKERPLRRGCVAGNGAEGQPAGYGASGEPGGVADAGPCGRGQRQAERAWAEHARRDDAPGRGPASELAAAVRQGPEGAGRAEPGGGREPAACGGVRDSSGERLRRERRAGTRAGTRAARGDGEEARERRSGADDGATGGARTFWSDPAWAHCDDPSGARWRPIEPGSFPLAPRAPGDVGRLRSYGNALCAPQAEAFIRAYLGLTH